METNWYQFIALCLWTTLMMIASWRVGIKAGRSEYIITESQRLIAAINLVSKYKEINSEYFSCMVLKYYKNKINGKTNYDKDIDDVIGSPIRIIFGGKIRDAVITRATRTKSEFGCNLDMIYVKLNDRNIYTSEIEVHPRMILWDNDEA